MFPGRERFLVNKEKTLEKTFLMSVHYRKLLLNAYIYNFHMNWRGENELNTLPVYRLLTGVSTDALIVLQLHSLIHTKLIH